MRRLLAVFMASALLLGAACSSGDKNSESGGDNSPDIVNAEGVAQRLYQPAGVVGPDSFSPSFELTAYQVTSDDPVLTGEVSASTPGIYRGRTYGGTGGNICDVEKMIEFLTYYEDRGRAWAEIQGIPFDEIGSFIRGLEPVYVTQDINVRMYGFKDGEAYGYEAIIGAGTAILIDDQGMPRARCACGNPLSAPQETPESTTTSGPDISAGQNDESTTTQATTPEDTTPDSVTDSKPPVDTEPPIDTVPVPDNPCPDLEQLQYGVAVSYTDSNGDTWVWDSFSGRWRNTNDPGSEGFTSIYDIPGYTEDCGDPWIDLDLPCPEEVQGARYTDPSGTEWIWTSGTPGGANWLTIDENGDQVYVTTAELPGVPTDCVPDQPRRERADCPEVYQGAEWTDPDGNVWRWVSSGRTGDYWLLLEDGIPVYVNTAGLPGVPDDCPEPPPCPPLDPQPGQQWTDPDGNVWILRYIDKQSRIATWDLESTPSEHENVDTRDLPGYDDCYPPQPTTECPPEQAPNGTVWTDGDGVEWVYWVTIEGDGGWDRTDTDDVEFLSSRELPGAEDCFDPLENPCPPIQAEDGMIWSTPDGRIFVYEEKRGAWVNTRDDGDRFVLTVTLPGYYDECLPPCPPLQPGPDEDAYWFDLGTGEMWTWRTDTWTSENGDTVGSTIDLPWYRIVCLPPCKGGEQSGGQQQSWVEDEDGNPVTNTETQPDAGARPAITIVPGSPAIEEAANEKLAQSSSAYDACNPVGCVPEGQAPTAGHRIIDSNGVTWVFGGDGVWYSTNGQATDDVRNIPGYVETCLNEKDGGGGDGGSTTSSEPAPDNSGPDPVAAQPCPPEFEGSIYRNSEGVQFVWTGGNARNRPSDRGEHWFNADVPDESDGDFHRYTTQLEPDGRFANCPTDQTPREGDVPTYWSTRTCFPSLPSFPVVILRVWTNGGAVAENLTAATGGAALVAVSLGGDGIWGITLAGLAAGSHDISVEATLTGGVVTTFTFNTSVVENECSGQGRAAVITPGSPDDSSDTTVAEETTTTVASQTVFTLPTLTVRLPRISIPPYIIPTTTVPTSGGTTTVVPGSPSTTIRPIVTLAPIRPVLPVITTTTTPRATTTIPLVTLAPIRPIILPTTTVKP